MATTSFLASFSSSFLTGSSGFASFFLNLDTLGSCSMELGGFREHHGEVRRNGFPLAIGVARQIHGIGRDRGLPQIVDDFAFTRDDLQCGLENLVVIRC